MDAHDNGTCTYYDKDIDIYHFMYFQDWQILTEHVGDEN